MKNFFKAIAFAILTGACIFAASRVLTYDDSYKSQTVFKDYYALPENTIDIACIGNSSIQRGFVTPYAWNNYGASTYSLAFSSEPFPLTPYIIKEMRKTQDPSVYIIDIRNAIEPGRNLQDSKVRRVTDTMKQSKNRYEAINEILKFASDDNNDEMDPTDKSYYIKLLKYHGLWDSRVRPEYDNITYYNGFTYVPYFNYRITPEENIGNFTTKSTPIEPKVKTEVNKVLDYCDTLTEEGKHVLFVVSPYAASAEDEEKLNYVQNMMEKRGYTVLNFNHKDLSDAIDIDYEVSFYNTGHMNLVAANRFTDYLMKYVEKNYGLTDHRGEKAYSDWQKKVDKFNKINEPQYKKLVKEVNAIKNN